MTDIVDKLRREKELLFIKTIEEQAIEIKRLREAAKSKCSCEFVDHQKLPISSCKLHGDLEAANKRLPDDDRLIKVTSLSVHLQTLLRKREFSAPEISARGLAREYAGWKLGDESWADQIIGVYNEAINTALAD